MTGDNPCLLLPGTMDDTISSVVVVGDFTTLKHTQGDCTHPSGEHLRLLKDGSDVPHRTSSRS
jgi:hypothetical protein